MPDRDDRLTLLEDRDAIRDLIARYGVLADRGDADGVAALWETDGIYAVGGFGEARGHAEIAALISGPVHQALMADGCAHVMGPVTIDINGDVALARGHSLVVRHGAGGFEVFRASANSWQLRKGSEGWRVIRRDNAPLDGQQAARALFDPPV